MNQPRATTSGNDPLAELARLIGQNDPFGDAMHASARLAESAGAPPAVEWTTSHAPAQAPQSFAPNDFSYAQPSEPAHPHYVQPPAVHAPSPEEHAELYRVQQEVPGYLASRGPEVASDQQHHADDQQPHEQQDYYDDVAPAPRRRLAIVAVAAVFALAVIGTAGAFGYRALFGGLGPKIPPVIQADKSPLKIVPDNASGEGKKVIADRVPEATEKLLPREEKPVDIAQKIAETAPAQPSAAPTASAGNGVIGSEPRKVHTIVIRPDGSEGQAMPSPMPPQAAAPAPAPAPVATAQPKPAPAPPPARPAVAESKPKPAPAPVVHTASNAPLSLNPNAAPAHAPVRTANAGPAAMAAAPAHEAAAKSGAYAVQVSSQRSEAEAKAAFHGLQGKFPQQLGSKPMFVHKVDLGAKGIYYRTMVGPFASAAEASELCSGLKSAGGSCIVQRN